MTDETVDQGFGSTGDAGGGDDSAASAEVESKARNMGWQPKEQWKGNPDNWVAADEFVKRGETFVPFLQHDRKRLKTELEQRDQRLAALEREVKESKEALTAVTEFNANMAKERQARRKAEIGLELKAAREAGDDVKVAELQNELGEVVKPPTAPAPKTNGGAPPPPAVQPWVKNFIDTNNDFFQNQRKIALFNAIMIEKRQAGDTRVGEGEGVELLNEVRDEVERSLGGNARRQAPPKSEESRSTGGSTGPKGGKSYTDLPQDAREQCDKQEARFVGKPGFKDQNAWRRHFVSEYFGPSAIQMQRGE